MRKVIIVIIIMILFVMIALNAGQNTSTSELLLNESKARRNIEALVSTVESLGDAAFKGVEIQSKGFKGLVEQPPSFASAHLEKYQIKGDNLEVVYGKGNYSVTGKAGSQFDGAKYADSGLPALARKEILEGTTTEVEMGTLYGFMSDGIQPIIKDATDTEWIQHFLYDETGLALDKLITNNETDFAGLKGKTGAEAVKLMQYIFGDSTDGKLDWNGFMDDRFLSLKQVNNDALTGLDDLGVMANSNMTTIYLVSHVNTNILGELYDSTNEFGIKTAAQAAKLANHLAQMAGNKYVLIPHKTSSTLYVDGIATFMLN